MDIINKINVNGTTYQIGTTVVTLSTVPNTDTLSYNGTDFTPGDVVRVVDTSSDTGYAFYRLHTIESNQAVWAKLETGDVTIPEIVTVSFATNQSSTTDLQNVATATIAYGSTTETKTYTGSDITFEIPEDTAYTITFGSVSGYATPSTYSRTSVFAGRPTTTATYNTEVVTVTTQQSGVKLYVNNVEYTEPIKIAYGTSYTVTGEEMSGYNVSSDTFTANQSSRTVEVVYEEILSGIFAMTNTGQSVTYENIDTTNPSKYVGVVVRDAENGIAFFIDKRFPTGSSANASIGNYKAWSSALYGNDQSYLTNISTGSGNGSSIEGAAPSATREAALNAFKAGETGIVNTNNLVNDSNASSETAANNAAKYCRSIANPVTGAYDGYLGSLAEWIVVNDNQVEIN